VSVFSRYEVQLVAITRDLGVVGVMNPAHTNLAYAVTDIDTAHTIVKWEGLYWSVNICEGAQSFLRSTFDPPFAGDMDDAIARALKILAFEATESEA